MVRFATNDDFNFAKKSWAECFDDSKEFVDWNFAHNYYAENTIIAESGSSPASIMQLMPYSLVISGKTLNARYVSGVATLPAFRGQGLVRKMFDFALPEMLNMGTDISILVPAVDGMYEKFGYTKICSRKTLITDTLPQAKKINVFDADVISVLDRIYKNEMSKKIVYINRSKSDWEKILTDLLYLSGGTVLLYENGYALAYPKNKQFEVAEMCGQTEIRGEHREIPPVMARIIRPDAFLSFLPNLMGNVNLLNSFIQKRPQAVPVTDIANMTKTFFRSLVKSDEDIYINLLL